MSVFSIALDTIYNDPSVSLAAVYAPSSGPTVACRVLTRTGSSIQQRFGQTGFLASPSKQAAGLVVSVRVSEVALPGRGAHFAVDGGASQLIREVLASEHGDEWFLTLQAP